MGRCCPLWPSLATLPENNEGESNGEEGETKEINLHNARNGRAVSATGSAARAGSQGSAGVARRLGFGREAWRGRDVRLGPQPACAGRAARRMLLGRPHGHAGRAAREGRLAARARGLLAAVWGARMGARVRESREMREMRGERERRQRSHSGRRWLGKSQGGARSA
jgi:hypothetical protein